MVLAVSHAEFGPLGGGSQAQAQGVGIVVRGDAEQAAPDHQRWLRLLRGGGTDDEELAEFVMLLLEQSDLRPEGGHFLFQLFKF